MRSNYQYGRRKRFGTLGLALVVLGASACSTGGDDVVSAAGDGDGCGVTAWSAENFNDNAAEALALRESIGVLQSDMMNAAEQTTWGDAPTAAPSLQDLLDAYGEGSPSVADMTPADLDTLTRQTLTDWTTALDQDPATYRFIDEAGPQWIASGAGGMHERPAGEEGERRFRAYSSGGVELRQLVDKGLFVGTMYNYALGLTEDAITPDTIQQIAAAWGANPTLDPDPSEDEPENDDTAGYSLSMGLYDETADALTAAQAYAADEACEAERDEALVEAFRYWEEAAFARGTYYGAAPLRETLDPSDPETILGSIHGASEGLGLMLGLRGMPDPSSGPLAGAARVSTDADIDRALGALGVNIEDLSAGTSGEWLVEEIATYEEGFNGDFKEVVQSLFDWSDDQFAEYATEPVPTA